MLNESNQKFNKQQPQQQLLQLQQQQQGDSNNIKFIESSFKTSTSTRTNSTKNLFSLPKLNQQENIKEEDNYIKNNSLLCNRDCRLDYNSNKQIVKRLPLTPINCFSNCVNASFKILNYNRKDHHYRHHHKPEITTTTTNNSFIETNTNNYFTNSNNNNNNSLNNLNFPSNIINKSKCNTQYQFDMNNNSNNDSTQQKNVYKKQTSNNNNNNNNSKENKMRNSTKQSLNKFTFISSILFTFFLFNQSLIQIVSSEMIFEIKLLEFQNPSNKTYSNKECNLKATCSVGFLFCLIDLPFRNPQNCTLGDHITPVLGGNQMEFSNDTTEYTYQFKINQIPAQGMGMMIEVRDYNTNDTWEPLDFYTSALADVPLSVRSPSNTIHVVRKKFGSLFNHNSSLTVLSRFYCARNYFGPNCDVYCDETENEYYECDVETGNRICKNGFVGEYCNIPDICATLPCLHDGTCYSPDGINYMCQCTAEFTGGNCEHYLRRCTSNPCSKNCTCIEVPQNMSYECKCDHGRNRQSQERIIDNDLKSHINKFMDEMEKNSTDMKTLDLHEQSDSDIDYNFDTSEDDSYEDTRSSSEAKVSSTSRGSSSSTTPSNIKSNTEPSVQGTTSNVVTEPLENPCEVNNPCRHGVCFVNNATNEAECKCDRGYIGPFCDLMRHPCDFKPCENGGICEIVGGLYYKCLCRPNYTGVNCQTEVLPCENYDCHNGGNCTVDSNSEPHCICAEDYTGAYCEQLKDPCTSSPCKNNGTCNLIYSNAVHSTECTCTPDFTGDFCQTPITKCENIECMNDAECIQVTNITAECKCQLGFYGERCQYDIDECSTVMPCKNNAECKNTYGAYECICRKGFDGYNCETAIDICKNNPCSNNATCQSNSYNNYTCLCSPHHTGSHCEININACRTEGLCLNGGTCISDSRFPGIYSCECTRDYMGENCETKIDLCDHSNPCLNGGKCSKQAVNATYADYMCICRKGFSGKNCENEIDACESRPCLNNAKCHKREGGTYHCECQIGFHGSICEQDINVCDFGVCKNKGTCVDGFGANYTCICSPGFTGQSCQIDIDECEHNPCKNNAVCIETYPGEFKCNCLPSFSGRLCEIETFDKCLNYCHNNGTCIDNSTQPTCECAPDYSGARCENYIITQNPCDNIVCQNGGTCQINENKLAQCNCKWGFFGEFCESVRKCKEPTVTPCFNNGTCIAGADNYEYCSCTPYFTGNNCEIMLKSSGNQSIVSESSSVSSTPLLDAFMSASPAMYPVQDSGVWLIVIVFGYIFGLFLIFVIIWFVWYGTSIKRRQTNGSLSNNNLSQYDYSTQSSLSKRRGSYFPETIRTNPAYNNQDELLTLHSSLHPQAKTGHIQLNLLNTDSLTNTNCVASNSISNMNTNTNNNCSSMSVDDISSHHSTSFINTFQNQNRV